MNLHFIIEVEKHALCGTDPRLPNEDFKLIFYVFQIVIALSFHPEKIISLATIKKNSCGKWQKAAPSRKEIGKSKHINAGFIAIFTDKWNCRFVFLLPFCDYATALLSRRSVLCFLSLTKPHRWQNRVMKLNVQKIVMQNETEFNGNVWFNGRQLDSGVKVCRCNCVKLDCRTHSFMLILRKPGNNSFFPGLCVVYLGQICHFWWEQTKKNNWKKMLHFFPPKEDSKTQCRL